MIKAEKGRIEFRGTEEDIILEFAEILVCLARQRFSVDFLTSLTAASLAFASQDECDDFIEVLKDEVIKHGDDKDNDLLKKMFGDLFNE